MNSIEPMLACGSMHFSPGAIALILFFVAGWWISGALAMVNPLLLSRLKVPAQFKKRNFVGWACYVVPGIILLLGLYGEIPLHKTPSEIWMVYAVVIPFVTVSHFVYLLRTRRKLRATSANPPDENGV